MRNKHRKPRLAAIVTVSSLCLSAGARAEEADAFKSLMDDVWDKAVLYKNPDNPYIQKLAFTGRAQLDYAVIEGEGDPAAGVTDSDLDYEFGGWRRLRGGFKATVFNDFTLHTEADFNPDENPWYQRITDAYVAWAPCEAFELKVGKQGMGFTLDGSTSSKELITIDRNNLSNNLWFTNEYVPGITAGGKIDNWLYTVGLFSQGEEDGEFGNFDGGTSWLATIGYDLSGLTGGDESVIALDYVFNEETPSNPSLFTNRSLGNIFSLNFRHEKDAFGFRGDIAYGDGFLGQSDMWGLVLMPYYNINDKLQAVFRYTFIESDSDNGVRFARYESEPMLGRRGDQYQEAYLGLNYFIYGHKLKLQTGLQYVSMRDQADDGGAFDGLAWTTGIRLSW
jgi:phosphate-selective porin OprO and OprP